MPRWNLPAGCSLSWICLMGNVICCDCLIEAGRRKIALALNVAVSVNWLWSTNAQLRILSMCL
jgi:hypothetical protein